MAAAAGLGPTRPACQRHFTQRHFTQRHFTQRLFHPTPFSPNAFFTQRLFHPTPFHPTPFSPRLPCCCGWADVPLGVCAQKPPHVLLNHMYHAVGGRATEAASGAAAAGDAAATTAPKIMTVTTRYVDKGSGDKFVANVYYTR
jgi:hypothetical protein